MALPTLSGPLCSSVELDYRATVRASDDADAQSRNAAFLQGLQELGWTVGRNVRMEYRWGAGDLDRFRRRGRQ
jgi:hypothetical protein